MNIEFHYFITFILCRKAGFDPDESYKIAYSSQYTDDNDSHKFVNFRGGGGFTSKISQTMDVSKPEGKHKSIYPYFHFIPGGEDASDTCDFKKELKDACKNSNFRCGEYSCLLTAPNSKNARDILNEAMNTDDKNLLLFRLGIAIHAYADTWSHQNFVGYENELNSKKMNLIDLKLCHANFKHDPDKINNQWRDERLNIDQNVDNNARFLQAAKEIFLRLYRFKNPTASELQAAEKYEEIELEKRLKRAMRQPVFKSFFRKNTRLNSYREICPELKEEKYNYKKNEWFKNAIEPAKGLWGLREINVFDKYIEAENFRDSNWYKFQKAVEKHIEYCKKNFDIIYDKHKLERVAYE